MYVGSVSVGEKLSEKSNNFVLLPVFSILRATDQPLLRPAPLPPFSTLHFVHATSIKQLFHAIQEFTKSETIKSPPINLVLCKKYNLFLLETRTKQVHRQLPVLNRLPQHVSHLFNALFML